MVWVVTKYDLENVRISYQADLKEKRFLVDKSNNTSLPKQVLACLPKLSLWDLECVIYGGTFLESGREADLGREEALGGTTWPCKYNNTVCSSIYQHVLK